MKKTALSLLLLFASAVGTLTAQTADAGRAAIRNSKANFGVKAGFNSSMFFVDRFSIGETSLNTEELQNNYKVGYFASFFCRFNLKKHHFIQPELTYNIAKGSISAGTLIESTEPETESALIKTTLYSFDLPVLYGYKFIDRNPYGMAFFIGPKIAYVWEKHSKNEYSGFYQQGIREDIRPLIYSAVLGLAVNVSNIFFDFRYEVGLHNITHAVTYDHALTPAEHAEGDIFLKRRKNTLSFSLGVIF